MPVRAETLYLVSLYIGTFFTVKTRVSHYHRNIPCKQIGMQCIPYCLQRAFLRYAIHTYIFRVFFLLFHAGTISTDAGTTISTDAGTTITWYILAPTLSVLLLLFVILSCFYYRVHQKKCTVHGE